MGLTVQEPVTDRCQSNYGGQSCTRPAIYMYRAVAYWPLRLCQECADRLCDTPDMPSVGRQIRARMSRIAPELAES